MENTSAVDQNSLYVREGDDKGRIADPDKAQEIAILEKGSGVDAALAREGQMAREVSGEMSEEEKRNAEFVAMVAENYPDAGRSVEIDGRPAFVVVADSENALVFTVSGVVEVGKSYGSGKSLDLWHSPDLIPGVLDRASKDKVEIPVKSIGGVMPTLISTGDGGEVSVYKHDLQTDEGKIFFKARSLRGADGIPAFLEMRQREGKSLREAAEKEARVVPAEDLYAELGLKKNESPKVSE